jgi:hypothetical protein
MVHTLHGPAADMVRTVRTVTPLSRAVVPMSVYLPQCRMAPVSRRLAWVPAAAIWTLVMAVRYGIWAAVLTTVAGLTLGLWVERRARKRRSEIEDP